MFITIFTHRCVCPAITNIQHWGETGVDSGGGSKFPI